MKKSIIFFTMQTSASGSMNRIYELMSKDDYVYSKLAGKFARENRLKDLRSFIFPDQGEFVYYNVPYVFNREISLSNYRFIINYRDPRDRLCNVYHWQFVHPKIDGAVGEDDVERIRELGIDRWVLSKIDTGYYDNLIWLLGNLSPEQYIVQSYAKLCLDFDDFIRDGAEFIGVNLTHDMLEELELERTDNLSKNPRWIGNAWQGSDISPGRYKRELKRETIEILNEKFGNVLDVMAKHDPLYADTYLK